MGRFFYCLMLVVLGEQDGETATFAFLAFDRNHSAMAFDGDAYIGQTDTCSIFLGGKEWIENLRGLVGSNAASVIAYGQLDPGKTFTKVK